MANYFENLKNEIIDFFSFKRKGHDKAFKIEKDHKEKHNIPFNQGYVPGQDTEETISLMMDENDRPKLLRATGVDKSYNAIVIFSTNRLPFIYGFFSLLTIIFMIGCAYFNNSTKNLYSEMGTLKTKYLSLFDLPRVNFLVFHLLNSCTGLSGLAIVISVYLILHMKFKINKYNSFQFAKLYVSILYGVVSNLFHILYGLVFFLDGVEKLNLTLKEEIYLTLPECIFTLQIFFSILFGIFTTCIVYNLKSKPSYSLTQETTLESEKEFKWINYKLITVIYLVFFSLVYILVLLHSNNIIFKTFNNPVLLSNYSYLLAILPYGLYFLNLFLYLVFYDELRNSNLTLSQPTEKIGYEKNQKNIL